MRSARIKTVLWTLGACVVLDQLTKEIAIRLLKGTPPIIYLGNLFRFEYAENPGAFLGLGGGLSDGLRFWLMTVVVGLILLLCVWSVVRDSKLGRVATFGFALVIAGGVSNLLDRLFRTDGKVVDFMNLGIGSLRTGIFNIADVAILGGVFLVLIPALQPSKKSRK
jgi:signal peptidase II